MHKNGELARFHIFLKLMRLLQLKQVDPALQALEELSAVRGQKPSRHFNSFIEHLTGAGF
jgi:hypothetical protein